MNPGTRAVCIREVQKSLKDSAKRLIEDKIQSMGASFVLIERPIFVAIYHLYVGSTIKLLSIMTNDKNVKAVEFSFVLLTSTITSVF